MYRPIIVLCKPTAGAHHVAYLGEDAAAAEAEYQKLSADPAVEEVVEYYMPARRRTATPASAAQVNAMSTQMQESAARERIRQSALTAATLRLTADAKKRIAEEAAAEAEAAVQAAALVGDAITRVAQKASTPTAAEAAVVDELIAASPAAAELAAAQSRADQEAGPEQDKPSATANTSDVEDGQDGIKHFAASPRRSRNSKT